MLPAARLIEPSSHPLSPAGAAPLPAQLKESACKRYSKSDSGSRLCHMLPGIEARLAESMSMLTKSCAVLAVSTVALAAMGCW